MHMTVPMIATPQGWEWILIVLVILLLFGSAKLPDLARGTGRALRIFKAETKGLRDDDAQVADHAETATAPPPELTTGETPAAVEQGDTASDPVSNR